MFRTLLVFPFDMDMSVSYHHRREFLPLVAHCRQCLLLDTTAQVPQTLFPQSLHANELLSTAPPMSMSASTSMLSLSPRSSVSQSSQRDPCVIS